MEDSLIVQPPKLERKCFVISVEIGISGKGREVKKWFKKQESIDLK